MGAASSVGSVYAKIVKYSTKKIIPYRISNFFVTLIPVPSELLPGFSRWSIFYMLRGLRDQTLKVLENLGPTEKVITQSLNNSSATDLTLPIT